MYLPFNLLTITAISIAFTFFCFAADNVFKRSANYHWSFLHFYQLYIGIFDASLYAATQQNCFFHRWQGV